MSHKQAFGAQFSGFLQDHPARSLPVIRAPIRSFIALLLLFQAIPAISSGANYEAWLNEAIPSDGPGAAVIVVRDGDVIFRGGAGMANLELQAAMGPNHVFRIASITKQFTAAAILLLQDRGQLNITDDIGQYLPNFPTHGERITIAHLLSHTSGVFNFTDIPGYWRGALIRTDLAVNELIDLFADRPRQFRPGSKFSYSNSGYTLLGAIIERVSGQSYAEFLRTEIFEPLEMNDTQYGGRHLVARRASGYQLLGPNDYVNALPISMTHPYAAGGLLSTVDDLARWNAALFDGGLLSDESLQAMITPAQLNDGTSVEYGYGFYVRKREGLNVISHSGGIHGFSTSALWLPDERIYVAVLVNLENSGKANELAWRYASSMVSLRRKR